MQAKSTTFKPETVAEVSKIYDEFKDSIEFKARFGNQVERAFAHTIFTIAGVQLGSEDHEL